MFFERKNASKRNVANRPPARDVIRMELNWGAGGAILVGDDSPGTHQGPERLGQPSTALGCPVWMDKPVVLFGNPANF